MKLYSYVIARDYGFAPNPFYGVCTLATCKPVIRKSVEVGDWVIGTGSKQNGLEGKLIFAMKVEETLSYTEYWNHPDYQRKKPNLRGSLKQAFGDNIYHKDHQGWVQANSHHSFEHGQPNDENLCHDTQSDRVLIGKTFAYWGGGAYNIPEDIRSSIVKKGAGHRCNIPQKDVDNFVQWFDSLGEYGYSGEPYEWRNL